MKNLPEEIEDFYKQCKFIMGKLKIAIEDETVPIELRNHATKYHRDIYSLVSPMHDLLLEFSKNTIYTVGRRPIGSLEYIEKHETPARSPVEAKRIISDKFKEINSVEFEVINVRFSWGPVIF